VLIWQFNFAISDAAVSALLFFLLNVLRMISVCFSSAPAEFKAVDEIANFPKTIKAACEAIGIKSNAFVQYIVCPKCSAVFDTDFGYTTLDHQKVPQQCPFVEYPNHTHMSKRMPCGAYLTKVVKQRNTQLTIFKPHKVFVYQPLKEAVTNLVKRKGFLEQCERWRERDKFVADGILGDIYDAQIWKDFQTVGGTKFLDSSFNLGFTLNVDWFQPFTRTRKFVAIVVNTCIPIYKYIHTYIHTVHTYTMYTHTHTHTFTMYNCAKLAAIL